MRLKGITIWAWLSQEALPCLLRAALVENGSFPGDGCQVLSEAEIGGRPSEEAEGIRRTTMKAEEAAV